MGRDPAFLALSPRCPDDALLYWGAPHTGLRNWRAELKFAESGTMTCDNVADFGPGVLQPSVGIYVGYYGEERVLGQPPYAAVQTGQTVSHDEQQDFPICRLLGRLWAGPGHEG